MKTCIGGLYDFPVALHSSFYMYIIISLRKAILKESKRFLSEARRALCTMTEIIPVLHIFRLRILSCTFQLNFYLQKDINTKFCIEEAKNLGPPWYVDTSWMVCFGVRKSYLVGITWLIWRISVACSVTCWGSLWRSCWPVCGRRRNIGASLKGKKRN